MKKLLGVFLISILSLFLIQAQDNTSKSYAVSAGDTVTVTVKTTDVSLPIKDTKMIYDQIDRLKESNKLEYDAMISKLNLVNSKIDNIVYKESDAKIEYIATNFGMTEKDITNTIRRSSAFTIVACIIPVILLFSVWWKLYRFRQLEASNALIWVILMLVVALVTGFLIKFTLEHLFNQDMAVLTHLQNLL